MNKTIIVGLVCLAVGIAGTAAYYNTQNQSYKSGMESMHQAMTTNQNSSNVQHDMISIGGNMGSSMDAMIAGLQGKTGNEFDKAFISEMILHHQGAVKMAKLALQNAKHQEIKDLANAIISAQNKEIKDMRAWQEQWYNIK